MQSFVQRLRHTAAQSDVPFKTTRHDERRNAPSDLDAPATTNAVESIAAPAAAAAFPLHELCDDILCKILGVDEGRGRALDRYRLASTLSSVSKGLRASLADHPSVVGLVEEASRALIANGRRDAVTVHSLECCPRGELLDLSSMSMGTLECRLLALAMANGLLSDVTSLWLQNNRIRAPGLRWLARGLRSMPPNAGLGSISLGQNPFHLALVHPTDCGDDADQGERPESRARRTRTATRHAIDKLTAAAAPQRVRVRLYA